MLLTLFKKFLSFFPWLALLFILTVVYRPDLFFKIESAKSGFASKSIALVPVSVGKVAPRTLTKNLKTTGSFKGLETIAIIPKVEGRVSKVFHDVGDEVYPGDPLLLIDETDLKLVVNEAKKSLELEMAKLGLSNLPDEKFVVTNLPMVAKAAILEKNAVNKLDRLRRIGTASSVEEREQSETESKVAKVNLDNAILDVNAALANIRYKQALLSTAEQKLKDARILVPVLQNPGGVDYATFISSLNGKTPLIVYSKGISEGEMVHLNPAEPLFRLTLDRVLKLQVSLPEKELSQLKLGQKASISVEAYPGKIFSGSIARIYPTVDPLSRTFQLEIVVVNVSRELKPGFFAKVLIEVDKVDNVLTVPEESVVSFAGVTKVFRVEGDKVKQIEVKLGQRLPVSTGNLIENWVEVSGDLKAGDFIVISGQNSLAENSTIKIRSSVPSTNEGNKDL
ncbi:MAG: efflux RND transporter periplasmic adaptor subunit [Planctomycetes bacterium]|nr:efflux RND transporter periplasmic adaptor subunit [Planctomycetota bacterium]NBY00790.1 efflux RND transporter periplasmic adaptor subunit [Planctomycetota bacterium]